MYRRIPARSRSKEPETVIRSDTLAALLQLSSLLYRTRARASSVLTRSFANSPTLRRFLIRDRVPPRAEYSSDETSVSCARKLINLHGPKMLFIIDSVLPSGAGPFATPIQQSWVTRHRIPLPILQLIRDVPFTPAILTQPLIGVLVVALDQIAARYDQIGSEAGWYLDACSSTFFKPAHATVRSP